MKTDYKLGKKAKIIFYFYYLYCILTISFECKKGRKSLILCEFIWAIQAITRKKLYIPSRYLESKFITKYGKFTIDPHVFNVNIVSAISERLDIELFLKLLKQELDNNKKVLFLDAGACFGTYTVAVGNAFKNNNNLTIYAFEPDIPLSKWYPFAQLKKNVIDNNIHNVRLFHVGLGSKNDDKSGKSGITLRRLDSLIFKREIKMYDSVFIKMDIEGNELEAMRGAREFIENVKEITLLVEDFIDEGILKYLEKDFVFYKKLTPYNSFWKKIN